MEPRRKNTGGRKSEQQPNHLQPKLSTVQSAVGCAHQKSDPIAICTSHLQELTINLSNALACDKLAVMVHWLQGSSGLLSCAAQGSIRDEATTIIIIISSSSTSCSSSSSSSSGGRSSSSSTTTNTSHIKKATSPRPPPPAPPPKRDTVSAKNV